MPRIHLSQKEKQLFSLLIDVNKHFKLNSCLRVAGGWVRDKILYSQTELSHCDIDIVVDNLSGVEFASYIEKLHGTSFASIKANPEQSKHLQTATGTLLGMSIDFANLRSESYASSGDNRIPDKVQVGTPLEDARRRDFTVNALFYRLDTGDIEDFLESGMNDLHLKVLRTPIDPRLTFMDDPLRLMRCFRFLGQLEGFSAHNDILEAVRSSEIQHALQHKVSKERIGIEMGKLVRGKFVFNGLLPFVKLGLVDVVLSAVNGFEKVRRDIDRFASLFSVVNLSNEVQMQLILLFLLRDESEDSIQNCLLNDLKQSKKVTDFTVKASRALNSQLIDFIKNKQFNSPEAVDWIRLAGDTWEVTVLLYLFESQLDFSQFTLFIESIRESKSIRILDPKKRLVNGRDVLQICPQVDKREIKFILDQVHQWEVLQENLSKPEAIDFLSSISSMKK